MKGKGRISDNAAITAFINQKEADQAPYSIPELDFISGYTGDGGLVNQGVSSRGVLYEYYTPFPIVEAMWALAKKYGFTRGKILEPSCGIGRFLRYVNPAESSVDAYEFSKDNKTSFIIAKRCFPWANITNNYFESIFYSGNKRVKSVTPSYDLVVGNPPYGKFTGFYAGDKREGGLFPGSKYDQYFIWAGLQLLKPGGLLVFVIPTNFLSGGGDVKFRDWISDNSVLLDAYRLPVGTFTATDIVTDIIVLKKL